ncbi:Cof-type HAD-IIB family hydrolase [Clostridium carnis]
MKYLASDLDGTLVHENKIKKQDIEAILKLKEKGYKFIISTGRSLSGIDKIFDNYPEVKYDYIVACNGAFILDKDRNIIYDNQISSEVAERVFRDYIDSENVCMHFEANGENFLIDPLKNDGIEELLNYFQDIIPRDKVFNQNKTYTLISLFTRYQNRELAEETKNILLKNYEKELEVFRNQHFIDIAPKNCSKGNGILKVLELDGGNVEKLYTIGDSYNDISMFKITENSFTFNDVEDGVKEMANNYVNSVSECIEKIISK